MINQVYANFQPADCSQSQNQDNGIGVGLIDFNFSAIVTKTSVAYNVLSCEWRMLGDVIRHHNYLHARKT